jgi:hypothetical protein
MISTAQGFLLKRGGVLVQTAPSDEIVKVLDMLRPLSTTIPLIRVGGDGDGGYLLPDDIEGIDAVYSPGVADTATFESFFADRGVDSYLIDASVSAPPVHNDRFHFQGIWLAAESVDGVSITLEDWLNENNPTSRSLLLQIDIEGAEYESLLSTPSARLGQFRIIVLEMHELHAISTPMGGRLVSALLTRLKETHYLVHTHVNNCCAPLSVKGVLVPDVVELTFLRKDRAHVTGEFATVPSPLDQPNTENPDWQMTWER